MGTSTTPATQGTTWAATVARRLRDAHSFVDVGLVTCAVAREHDLDCAVALLSSSELPLITVETVDAHEKPFSHAAPIIALTEIIGVIHWRGERPLTAYRQELASIVLHVSVRMAQLGHTSYLDELDMLTARQIETASMAALGYTNSAIAEHMGVSENTIKKHIGEVFARLHIANRTELALRFSRLATIDLVPAGVSCVGDCRITRIVRPQRSLVAGSGKSGTTAG